MGFDVTHTVVKIFVRKMFSQFQFATQRTLKILFVRPNRKNTSFRVTRPTVFLEPVRFFYSDFFLFESAMTEARFSSPNSPTETFKRAHRHLHWKRVLVDDVDDVGDLCDRPGGSEWP